MYTDPAASEFFNQTTLHPLGIVALLAAAIATLLVPRRYALVPMLALACFISPAQRLVVFSFDFNFLRIILLVGWARVILRDELRGFRWKTIDSVVVLWAVCALVMGIISDMTAAESVNHLGRLYDAAGLYLLCRVLIRSWDDIRALAQSAALISVPVALFFILEKTTGRNVFSVFGGVAEFSPVRKGVLRCQGPFRHPILAGCFWAVLMPLMGALWFDEGRNRILGLVGVASGFIVVVTCASATPLGGVLAGLAAVALFPMRHWMSPIRWGIVFLLVLLQLAMIKPIWHLIARIDIVSGSTGWYRYLLIDEFVKHFDEWWLAGTNSYVSWWEYEFNAITNQYVAQGINGGLLTLILFVAMIVVGFRAVGRICRGAGRGRLWIAPIEPHRASGRPRRPMAPRIPFRVAMAWAIGVSLFIHCVMFFGVTYFGQTILVWYLTLAMIGSLAPPGARRRIMPRFRVLGRGHAVGGIPARFVGA